MDLSVAFNTVDHNILLEVLNKNFGIEGTPLQQFTSYLRPRSCKVNISSNYSNEKQLQFSIPQGSCTGPRAYLAYASTMREIPTLSKPTSEEQILLNGFADDHHLVKKEFTPAKWEDESKCIHDLQHCMKEVQGWMEGNWLKLNSNKTKFILFSLRQMLSKCITTNIEVNGHTIDRSIMVKYLGAWLDQELKLKQHTTNKCRLAMANIQRIKNLRPILIKQTMETVAIGIVMSHLGYCNTLFIGLPSVIFPHYSRFKTSVQEWPYTKNNITALWNALKLSIGCQSAKGSNTNCWPSYTNTARARLWHTYQICSP